MYAFQKIVGAGHAQVCVDVYAIRIMCVHIYAFQKIVGAGHAHVCVYVHAIWIMCVFICMPSKRLWALGMRRYVFMCMPVHMRSMCVSMRPYYERIMSLHVKDAHSYI